MKGGFLHNASLEKPTKREPNPGDDGMVEWDEYTLHTIVKVLLQETQHATVRAGLERRVKSGLTKSGGGGGSGAPDFASRLLEEATKPGTIAEVAAKVMEKSASVWSGMMKRAKKEGLTMQPDEEDQVRTDVLREALVRELVAWANAKGAENAKNRMTDAGLLALPAGYRGAGGLDYLSSDTIASFMSKGWGMEDRFLGRPLQERVLQELDMLNHENKFEETFQQVVQHMRDAKVALLDMGDLDREKQPALRELFEKMVALPFEVNKKCGNLLLQASGTFEVACYTEKGFYKAHMDGTYDAETENGRKVSMMYLPGMGVRTRDGGNLQLYTRQAPGSVAKPDELGEPELDTKPGGDKLVLFFSRDIPWELCSMGRKIYVISLWSSGPAVLEKDLSAERKP